MHLKVIKSQQCSVERSHVVLKLILNSDQGLALFKQTQILTGLLVTKNLQKSEDFFIQLLNAWLHLTNNNFPAFISIEKILDQPIFLLTNPLLLTFVARFPQPGLTSCTIFHKNFTRFSYCQHKIFKLTIQDI